MVEGEADRRNSLRAAIPLLHETIIEEDVPENQYNCLVCKAFCYLAQVTCTCSKAVSCLDHARELCTCPLSKRTLRIRYSDAQLEEILADVANRARLPEVWLARLDEVLAVPRPSLRTLRGLLADGERIAFPIPEVQDLRAMVERANAWVEKVTSISTRKSTARRRKGDAEEDDPDRSPQKLQRLLTEAQRLGFDAPEIQQLRQTMLSIKSFQNEAASILATPDNELDIEKCQTALILGNSLHVDLPEIGQIDNMVKRLNWYTRIEEEVDDRTIQYHEIQELIEEAKAFGVDPSHPSMLELRLRESKGRHWQLDVDAVLSQEMINLDEISALIDNKDLVPTELDTMLMLEKLRKDAQNWQTSASTLLQSHGSAMAAQRLCRSASSQSGAAAKLAIPELDYLKQELDFHDAWFGNMAAVLRCQIKQVNSTLVSIWEQGQAHLAHDDEKPNDYHACFCRGPPIPLMVTCQICDGEYHPKCVSVSTKNIDAPFTCGLCGPRTLYDRASLSDLGALADRHKWDFLLPPTEFFYLQEIVETCLTYARHLLPFVDPLNVSYPCKDVPVLAHHLRKLFLLPIAFDAINASDNVRVNLEDWLAKRLHDAMFPSTQKARKGRLILAEEHPNEDACICRTPPQDPAWLECSRCRQGFHAGCVRAPTDVARWTCLICTVKLGKYYHRGVDLRVQTTGETVCCGVADE